MTISKYRAKNMPSFLSDNGALLYSKFSKGALLQIPISDKYS